MTRENKIIDKLSKCTSDGNRTRNSVTCLVTSRMYINIDDVPSGIIAVTDSETVLTKINIKVVMSKNGIPRRLTNRIYRNKRPRLAGV